MYYYNDGLITKEPFYGLDLLIQILGRTGALVTGPTTATGHVPEYVDNGPLHCFLFSVIFVAFSSVGLGFYDLAVLYDDFFALVSRFSPHTRPFTSHSLKKRVRLLGP